MKIKNNRDLVNDERLKVAGIMPYFDTIDFNFC